VTRSAAASQAVERRGRRCAYALEQQWYAPTTTIGATLLRPFAVLFGAGAALRRAAYRRGLLRATRVRVPVIVVGNLAVGGSGKTPLVIALSEALRARGRRPGVVSRGYGRRTPGTRAVRAGDDARDVGDEPLLLAATGIATWIGARRVAAAQELLDAHPDVDVVVADDGLQHYALARDVEIAVVDASRALGNGLLLPAGPLREPRSRLATVDAVVWLRSAATTQAAPHPRQSMPLPGREFSMTHEPGEWINLRDPALRLAHEALQDPRSVAIAGIAHPERFFESLRQRGFRGRACAFPDHHAYAPGDVAFQGAPAILMTAKDAVKCAAFADVRMWKLPIRARIDPALVDLILEKIDGSQAPRNARVPGDERAADLRP
jgi:tetraacyldisaccharide 4'-kinase